MQVNCMKHGISYDENGQCGKCWFDEWKRENEKIDAAYKAHEILKQAADEMSDRAATYDKPEGERSMAACVAAFKAVTGIEMSEQQGWQFMELLKMVRSNQGKYRADSFIDGAAYAALAGEAASRNA